MAKICHDQHGEAFEFGVVNYDSMEVIILLARRLAIFRRFYYVL